MKASRLISLPEFKSVPKSELANVPENIDNWIEKGNLHKLDTFCRRDPKEHKGYCFVNSEDFTEVIHTNQIIRGVEMSVRFIRKYHIFDHFCPLYFSEWFTDCHYWVFVYPAQEFQSDNQLKKYIKNCKINT